MTKKILLGMAVFLLLSGTNNSNAPVGQNLYRGMTFVEVQAKGQNTGGGRVQGEQYRIELTVVFEVSTDRIVDILYTNTGNATTGGNFERLWTGARANTPALSNHATGYSGLITAFIGKTANELSQTSTSVRNNGADMYVAITGATQTTSNFVSSIKTASEEYLKGNAVKSTWKH